MGDNTHEIAERAGTNADTRHVPANRTVLIPDQAPDQGLSCAIREIEHKIDLVATSSVPVFITGESGTGKEVVARLIHRKSGKNPFVAVNCAALPRDVIENELFGHEKGAFTGSLALKAGCFELAHNGTIFLDEIAEMNPQTQAKLLRAIETKSFRRLGGRDEVQVDTRIIAATNRDPVAAMKDGQLREDLFFRLSVIEIHLPPLREHNADIVPLLTHFLNHFNQKYSRDLKGFSQDCLNLLTHAEWRGNIRELRNLVERFVLTCPDSTVDVHHLPERFSKQKRKEISINIPLGTPLRNVEETMILRTLDLVQDNKAKAARILGLSRKTLYDKLRSFKGSFEALPSDAGQSIADIPGIPELLD